MSTSEDRTNGNGYRWPVNVDVERLVLGAILTADPDTEHVWDTLDLEAFALRKHEIIYRRMRALHHRGEPVDRVTVAIELQTHGELQIVDGLSYLVTLDDGLPQPAHCRRYVEILRELALRRRTIQASHLLIQSMGELTVSPDILLREHRERLDAIAGDTDANRTLSRGDIWSYQAQLSYVVETLILENAITMFTAESGAGKSMLLLALAAAVAQGVPFAGLRTSARPAVYLDREMPLALVQKRLHDMGIERLYPQLRILGGREEDEAPGPGSRELLALARNEHSLFIFDPLIAFANCDENDAKQVRAHMRTYRPLCEAGGSVILSHNKSEKSESPYRGSSDHKGAIDAGWIVTRENESVTDDLKRLTLTALKTRTGAAPTLRFSFEEREFRSLDERPRPAVDIVVEIVAAFPGSAQKDVIHHGQRHGLPKHVVLAAIEQAVRSGQVLQVGAKGGTSRAIRYFPREGGLDWGGK
jgi:hypothetical protein